MTDRHQCLWTEHGCTGGTDDGPAKTEAPDTICDGCITRVERAVGEAPELFVKLHASIADKSKMVGQRVSGTMVPPCPLNVEVAATMDRIVEWFTVGALRVADAMNMDEDLEPESRITAEHARVLEKSCRILKPNIDRLIASPEDAITVWRVTGESTTFKEMSGIDVAEEIVNAHRRGWRILNPGDRQDKPCPLCRSKSVFRIVSWTSGGKTRDIVECQDCGKSWEYESYQQICRVALKFLKEEQVNESERLTAWLSAEVLWLQLQDALERLERLERGLFLAGTPEFAALPAGQFAREVLGEAA